MDDIQAKVAALEMRVENIIEELKELKDEVKDMRGLTTAIEKLTVVVGTMNEKIDATNTNVAKLDTRLESIEREPADDFRHYKRLAIGGIITGIIGIIFALVTVVIK